LREGSTAGSCCDEGEDGARGSTGGGGGGRIGESIEDLARPLVAADVGFGFGVGVGGVCVVCRSTVKQAINYRVQMPKIGLFCSLTLRLISG
jgi:hypothetical protein